MDTPPTMGKACVMLRLMKAKANGQAARWGLYRLAGGKRIGGAAGDNAEI